MRALLTSLLIAALLTGISACQDKPSEAPGVMHVVLVWLKQPGNAEHRAQIITGSKKLAAIPGVQDLQVGPAIPSEREVAMDDFDVALSLRFASEAELEAYLVHPLHKSIVKEEFVPIMDRFRVIDFRTE